MVIIPEVVVRLFFLSYLGDFSIAVHILGYTAQVLQAENEKTSQQG
jgi:hypothetical protein